MVVITGMGHAMRRGAGADLEKEAGLQTRIIMPVVDGMLQSIDEEDADYFVSE